eukprot:9313100-Lingulodinium_polyedra.AAC.1
MGLGDSDVSEPFAIKGPHDYSVSALGPFWPAKAHIACRGGCVFRRRPFMHIVGMWARVFVRPIDGD